ncbi:MAG: hypothetical protein ACREQQ_07015, partial [Candidatus Binatia bacterium]
MATAAAVGFSQTTPPEAVVNPPELGEKISITSISNQGGSVAGDLVNNTDQTLREVKLRIEYYWLWHDERHERVDDPSFSVTEVMPEEIPPRATMPFSYSFPAAKNQRTDGKWVVNVRVLGYTVVNRTTV